MAWDRDSLWAKSATFMERAFQESKDDPLFALWAAFGLELLARSAVSHVSPTLLAEPDNNHQYLLHALGRGSEKGAKRSLGVQKIFELCVILLEYFTEEEKKVCVAIINQRNEELHSGSCAFEEYKSSKWLSGFYRACKILSESQGYCLEDLFGEDEANHAEDLLAEKRIMVKGQVESKVAAHRKVFEAKSSIDQKKAAKVAEKEANKLSYQGHHKAICPACGSAASISGDPYGKEAVSHEDGEVVVRQPVSPRGLHCTACGLTLSGYAELEAVNLGGRYTRTSTYTPEDYFGLVDPGSREPEYEYDNE